MHGREHVVPEGPPGAQLYRAPHAWNSDPPTSGWHDPAPAPWGVHDTPIHPAVLVHNLEHSGVVVQYRDLPPEAVKGLAVLLQQDSPKLVLAPNRCLKTPIVATA